MMVFRLRLPCVGCTVKIFLFIALKIWAVFKVYILLCFLLYWLYGGVYAFLLLCFASLRMLYNAGNQLLYHPLSPSNSRTLVVSPETFNLPYESFETKSVDGTLLHMMFIPQPKNSINKAPTLIFLHGNAGNIGHRLENVQRWYNDLHCNILLIEYRGFGFSKGSPSEEGLYMDARTGIEYLYSRNDINTNEIIVFGQSLGGAVAIDICTKEEISERIWCLIVENTFTSIPDMAAIIVKLKIMQYLPLFLYKNKYLSLHKVRSLSVPILFISGRKDTIVPPKMMDQLFEACGSSLKKKCLIADGSHNDTWSKSGYYQTINAFLSDLRKNPPVRTRSNNKPWRIEQV